MSSVSLALLWHQHQPYYPDDVSGETLFPWVRLHGTKDYIGMALHLKEVPEFRCTINLVPSLLVQIQRYTDHGGSDRHLDVSRMPADGLGSGDALYLLDNFFMAHAEWMIKPYPRYHELFQKRGNRSEPAERALPRFSERDIRDLQVWSNLTWMHPLLFEQDAELRSFLARGQSWTEDEKAWLLDKQIEVLRRIIPLHRELNESGQVELTTTPFYHPILPLLWDKRSAREALPACPLPRHADPYPEDVAEHLARAVEFHQEVFGHAPRGMWPSEGSVSHDVIAPIAQAGIQWMATDEEVLTASTGGLVSRDGQGLVRRPEMLYRPWRAEGGGRSLQLVFRDHGLSDLIGFHYQRNEPGAAARDLISKVNAIGRAVAPHNAGRPALVPIILDGENCWEYYPDGGVSFLRQFYRGAAADKHVRPVRMGEHLEQYPATDRIPRLFAGSWISHNFAIWIGHEEDRAGWDLLHEARDYLRRRQETEQAPGATLQQAWKEIYIAEGSDWFWWFGDDHHSAQDGLFDQMFRKHLQNVYTLLGDVPPSKLLRPITRAQRPPIHSQPRGPLDVTIDGRRTYFEWIDAGHYEAGSERGTMAMVSEGLIRHVHFGFDTDRLLLRLDTEGPAREWLAGIEEVAIRFMEPAGVEVRLSSIGEQAIRASVRRAGQAHPAPSVKAAVDQVFEAAVPLSEVTLNPGDTVSLFIELLAGKQSLERIPGEGAIELTVPTPESQSQLWQV
jgi:alpha-amylase/alpha-mannosidase (GH57 family)